MKKYLIALPVLGILMYTSCTSPTRKELLKERDELMAKNASQADTLQLFKESLDSILCSLDSIYYQENLLFLPDEEHPTGKYSKKEINKKLDSFQQLVNRQKTKIDSLEASLQNKNSQIQGLTRVISYLRSSIEAKDAEIEQMRQELQSSKATVNRLTSQVNTMTQTIDELEKDNKTQLEVLQVQDAIINEGYVYMATQKELSKQGISTLFKKDLSKIDLSQATKIDIRYFLEVTIPSKNAKILSSMPKGSYTLEKTGSETILKINSPADFWSVSNILIVQY